MKEITLPSRINMFVTDLRDSLMQQEVPTTKSHLVKELSKGQRNRPDRKDFSYYMQVIDDTTQEFVGSLTDISSGGFKLDSQNPIPLNKDFQFRMNLTREVASKSSMAFVARSKWCKPDPLDPFCYNVGFQLIHISYQDIEIFNRMMEKYGTKQENRRIDLRRSNIW